MIKALILLASLIVPVHGQNVPPPVIQGRFLGENDTDASLSIGDEAQSALNVETSLNGAALLKRSGYARTASLAVSTSAPTGVYSFIDTSGNKQQIVCQDHNCAKSTNSSAFVVFLSTAGGTCIPTRWQFAQIAGFIYAVNDCYDNPWRYDGTTRSDITNSPPLGSIIEATKDRLVISGTTVSISNVYYSQSGTPTNFTTGINSADPYVDPIGAQGDKIRALKYALGRLFIFKTASITSCILGDQYTSKCFPVSNTVGTSDPLAIVEVPGSMTAQGMTSGALLFRGSDLNYWQLDQSGLNVISRKISTLVGTQTSGSNQSNTQNTQAAWQAGTQYPLSTWNTATTVGSIFPSSSTLTQNATTQFAGWTTQSSTAATISLTVLRGIEVDPTAAQSPASLLIDSPGFDNTFSTPTYNCSYSIYVDTTGDFYNFTSSMSVLFSSVGITGPWGSPELCASTSALATNSFPDRVSTVLSGNGPMSGKSRYTKFRLFSSFVSVTGQAAASFSTFTLTYAATGQFTTQCINPGPGISAFGLLSCAQTLIGAGSEVFYATSAATCGALPTGAPTSWQTSVTNNATLSISTNAAVYIGWRSLLGAATDQAQVNACTLYWTNGTPTPPSWGTYDPVKNAAYWTSAINNSSTANRVLKYDLNLNEWYPFGLNATALYRDQNTNAIYFGDSTGGYWNKYGGVNSDNGAAINSFWQGRDIGSQNGPFVDNSYNRISIVAKNQVTGSMNLTYNLSSGTSNIYVVSLSTTAGITYIHGNYNLLKASPFQFINIQLGNNSSTPFEVDALSLDMDSFGWKAQNP